MNKEKLLKLTTEDLPEYCYGVNSVYNTIIVIFKGEQGYYKTDIETEKMNPEEVEKLADILNEKRGISPEQRKMMELKSMFGNW